MTTYRVTWDETVTYEAFITADSVEEMLDKNSSGIFDYPEKSLWVSTDIDSLYWEEQA